MAAAGNRSDASPYDASIAATLAVHATGFAASSEMSGTYVSGSKRAALPGAAARNTRATGLHVGVGAAVGADDAEGSGAAFEPHVLEGGAAFAGASHATRITPRRWKSVARLESICCEAASSPLIAALRAAKDSF